MSTRFNSKNRKTKIYRTYFRVLLLLGFPPHDIQIIYVENFLFYDLSLWSMNAICKLLERTRKAKKYERRHTHVRERLHFNIRYRKTMKYRFGSNKRKKIGVVYYIIPVRHFVLYFYNSKHMLTLHMLCVNAAHILALAYVFSLCSDSRTWVCAHATLTHSCPCVCVRALARMWCVRVWTHRRECVHGCGTCVRNVRVFIQYIDRTLVSSPRVC